MERRGAKGQLGVEAGSGQSLSHPKEGGVPMGWSPVRLGPALPDEGPTESGAGPPGVGEGGSWPVYCPGAGEPDPPGTSNKASPAPSPRTGPVLPTGGPGPKPHWASGLWLKALQPLKS